MADALAWSGTFHAIGARLLREYAADIGLDTAFTIHDREDSADLMNLVRHDLGFSKMEKRFPMKGTCLAIYSRAVNAETPLGEVLGGVFPVVRRMGSRAAKAVRRLCGGQAEAERARLRRSAALLGADDDGGRRSPTISPTASITCWSTNIRTQTGFRPRSCSTSSRPAAA